MNPLTLGSPIHPPLVFLHGFLGRGRDWLPVAQAFADRFYCILPDLPGHGENTGFPLEKPLSYDVFVDDLAATLPSPPAPLPGGEDGRKINLVGYSMGGRTALYFALKYPELVQTLILESTSPGIEAEPARLERCKLDDRWAGVIRANGISAFVEEWYNIPLFRSLHRQPELLERVKAARRENSSAWMAKVITELSPADCGREVPGQQRNADRRRAAKLTGPCSHINVLLSTPRHGVFRLTTLH